MSFGLPYKGSKSAIAKGIVDALPSGNRLVDLFCGGCAITDYAMKKTSKYRKFLVNDLDPVLPSTYIRAMRGGFAGEERWISREEFHRLKNDDPYVSLCFSFGNNRKTYMYGPDIEPYKRALHYIIFWEDYKPMEDLCPQVVDIIKEYCKGKDRKGRRLASGHAVAEHIKQKGSVEYWRSNPMFRAVKIKWSEDRRGKRGNDFLGELRDANLYGPKSNLANLECLERMQSLQSLDRLKIPNSLQSLESLERLQNMESLKSLESLGRLERLERIVDISQHSVITATSSDYRNYEHNEGDVVYCDPPYANTDAYNNGDFDSVAFWEWVRTRDYPVYVSEYGAPDDFVSVWSKEKRRLFSKSGLSKPSVENLFLHKKWLE